MNSSKSYLTALFLLIAAFTYSQKYPMKYGITAGWNYSNVNAVDEKGEPSGYLSNGGELYGGITLEKQVSQKSYIQSGALVSYTYVITFIEIPLFYKYNFYREFSVIGGPKLDYIPDEQYNHSIYFKRRLGVSANLGINYQIFKKFNIEGYYSKQFIKQYDDNILTFYGTKRDVYRVGITYFIN
ncbi:hypothetical protein [uncultured Chryseobacterium sp.]|uniref:hypothetical protein n=1 Tax=uncultured Chryseobacterium sp. TaxID=259322 RepID=UPI0025E62B4C|nr:hypothetical protein [uncultured Chryseobacterium sp.]